MNSGSILILRHAESKKNIHGQFDGDDSTDALTESGVLCAKNFGKKLRPILEKTSFQFYCANSRRAKETVETILNSGTDTLKIVDEFGSMGSGPFSGMNDDQIRTNFPTFFSDLQKFRMGMISGYDIRTPNEAQKWKDFEKKIEKQLVQLENDRSKLKVIVCHRSAMMAMLVKFSRKLLSYPANHFGFMNVKPLSAVLLHYSRHKQIIEADDGLILLEKLNSSIELK